MNSQSHPQNSLKKKLNNQIMWIIKLSEFYGSPVHELNSITRTTRIKNQQFLLEKKKKKRYLPCPEQGHQQ